MSQSDALQPSLEEHVQQAHFGSVNEDIFADLGEFALDLLPVSVHHNRTSLPLNSSCSVDETILRDVRY
jgi:hypothetical protein